MRNIEKREKLILEIIWFSIKFSIFSIPIYLIKFFNLNLWLLQLIYASLTNYLLHLMAVDSTLFYTLSPETLAEIPAIHLKELNLSFAIDNSCTGYVSMLALTGLIFSTPRKKFGEKLKFWSCGLILVFFANLLRILMTILFALNFGGAYLDIVHNLLWRELLIIVILIIWILFLKYSK